ncbi:unnamed protein product, partial [Ectocarpus sp. 13 AM-2016]
VFELTNGPHQQGVFVFDNSSGHNAYDKDALLAHKINLAPGGEKADKCKADNAASRQAIAAFNKAGEEWERVLKQARREQQNSSAGDPAAAGGAAGRRQRCCLERVFSDLTAFKAQLNKVEQIFKEAGHVCIFLPKHHPELNAIERYWGYVKHVLRRHC